MDTNGQNVQQITHRQRIIDGGPAWSPDGKWLAFGAGDRGSWGIYLIDPKGRNETRIFHSNVSELDFLATSHPAWSPNSQHLVFIDPWREGDVGLIKIRVDGGLPTPLSTEDFHLYGVPRGRRMETVFYSERKRIEDQS